MNQYVNRAFVRFLETVVGKISILVALLGWVYGTVNVIANPPEEFASIILITVSILAWLYCLYVVYVWFRAREAGIQIFPTWIIIPAGTGSIAIPAITVAGLFLIYLHKTVSAPISVDFSNMELTRTSLETQGVHVLRYDAES